MGHQPDRAIRCGSHDTAAETFAALSGETTVTCPTCGRTDTLDFARAEAAKAELGGEIKQAIEQSSAADAVPRPPRTEPPRWVFGEPQGTAEQQGIPQQQGIGAKSVNTP